MKKIYHLSNCGTCQEIIAANALDKKGFQFQDIKMDPIDPASLDQMKAMAGSYDALFSRRALKYKSMGLKDRKLSEKDIRKLILEEYTFLKRPVIIDGSSIYIGSEKKTREAIRNIS